MNRHTGITAGVSVLAVAAGTLLGSAPPAAAGAATTAAVSWAPCPSWSDEALGVPPEEIPAVRALLARTECGTVRVPLDYRHPGGTAITVAITRLRATDQKNKLGTMAVNPGGPGGSGYLMPQQLVLRSPQFGELAQRYDLIGFDPRGVGYSTKVDCPRPPAEGRVEIPPGPIAEATARQLHDQQVAANQACWRSNPTFLAQLTTANVARDLDQVRRALRLSQISYFGVSWGTLMGAVHRSLFPQTVARMWLDSVVGPQGNRLDVRTHDSTAAQEQQAGRLAAWAAARNADYRLGRTAAEVLARITSLKTRLDASPVIFSDVPDQVLDGRFIAFLSVAPSPVWPDAVQALAEMTTAKSGDPAPPAVAPIITPPPGEATPPPADAPERMNPVANNAILCNDDTGPHDFATFWKNYQGWQREFPIAGSLGMPTEPCAGWPVPKEPFPLRRSASSLVMSGHRYESSTPYPWVHQMQAAIGGTVFTVDDDIHGSVARVPECADNLRAYFLTGRPEDRGCPGVTAGPAASATASPAAASLAVASLTAASSTGDWAGSAEWVWQKR